MRVFVIEHACQSPISLGCRLTMIAEGGETVEWGKDGTERLADEWKEWAK